jgi:GTP cyclohydrolase I
VFDQARIAAAVREIIAAIGEDPQREGLLGTPNRVARMFAEMFSGLETDPAQLLQATYEEGHESVVIVRDISFYSLCEHHFLPFFGTVHVGYLPTQRVVGVSKLARVVDAFARRPQLQERMTGQVADCVHIGLDADGVAVVTEAEHLCMVMRGVKKPGSRLVTVALRGEFRRNILDQTQLLSLVQGR